MPIDLNETINVGTNDDLMENLFGTRMDKPRVTPALFDLKLTGNGYGKVGYLNHLFANVKDNSSLTPHLHGDKTGFKFGFKKFVPKKGDFIQYPGDILEAELKKPNTYIERLNSTRTEFNGNGCVTEEMSVIAPSLYTSHFDEFFVKHNNSNNPVEVSATSDLFNLKELKNIAENAVELEDIMKQNGKLTNKEEMTLKDTWNTLFVPNVQRTHQVFTKTEVTYISKNRTVIVKDELDKKNPTAPPKPKKTEKFDYFFAPTTNIAFYPNELAMNQLTPDKAYVIHFNQLTANLNAVINLMKNQKDKVFIIRIPTKGFEQNSKAKALILDNLTKLVELSILNDPTDSPNIMLRFVELMENENLRDALEHQAINVRDHSTDMLIQLMDLVARNRVAYRIDTDKSAQLVHIALLTFSRIEALEESWVTVEDYNRIYKKLKELQAIFDWSDVKLRQLSSTQLRLMLSENLYLLDVERKNGQLYQFKAGNQQVHDDFMQDPKYSTQQKAIITTTEPLATVSAGAGSGKSYTLIGRLEYLKAQGEDLSRTMVLSFTNAAAQNITSRYPNIKSLTLGDLFNKIYSLTFPNQVLSHPTTFKNALSCVNVEANVFKRFNLKRMMEAKQLFIGLMDQLSPSGFVKPDVAAVLSVLSNFIAEYYEEAMVLMNSIHQTTLELQPIVIYNMLLNSPHLLQIPVEYDEIDFIITDESQDISTFEYILLLSLVTIRKMNMMIIGDGSQTLYEFRNSNPRFLTAIEASGVFESFRLTTNYRSKQAILNYANQFLQVIDANKIAKIQLQSNSLAPVTQQDIDKAIKIKYVMHGDHKNERKQNETLGRFIQENADFSDWFLSRVRNGEQVAFMSHTRKELDVLEESIGELLSLHGLQNTQMERIVTTREKPKCQLSDIINKKYEELIDFDVTQNYENELKDYFCDQILESFKNKAKAFVPSYVERVLNKILSLGGVAATKHEILVGNSDKRMLNGFVIQALIDEEIRLNAMANFLNKQTNATKDYSSVPIILTTIHSAKGLEFPHTVVIYNSMRKTAKKQETLRLYGVALTRAKESEFIIELNDAIGLSKVATSDLVGMYGTPIKTAKLRIDREAQGLSAGVTTYDDGEDEEE